jgi:hypothetical protein
MAKRGVRLRLHPCYEVKEGSVYDPDSGLPITLLHDRDKPVLFSGEHLRKEEALMGPGTFGVQMLCDPNAGALAGFRHGWLRYYNESPDKVRKRCNTVIVVDPASEKKKHNSRTAMWVFGYADDENYYLLDGVVDRLDLHQRTETLFRLVAQWRPEQVRYERYSMQADIQHIEYVQEQRTFRFPITEVGGHLSKDDRIQRLVPLFANRKIWFPHHIWYRRIEDDKMVNLVEQFVTEEYLVFPNSMEKDGLDAMSRIAEAEVYDPWPKPRQFKRSDDAWLTELRKKSRSKSVDWMGA